MNQVNSDQIRQNVRKHYRQIALQDVNTGNCCSISAGCCGASYEVSDKWGYTDEELSAVPAGRLSIREVQTLSVPTQGTPQASAVGGCQD